MRGTRWVLLLLLLTFDSGQATEVSLQAGVVPESHSYTTTYFGCVLEFPRAVSPWITPEIAMGLWSEIKPGSLLPSGASGSALRWALFDDKYGYLGRWDAFSTTIRLRISQRVLQTPVYVSAGGGVAHFIAWPSLPPAAVTYGIAHATGFGQIGYRIGRKALYAELDREWRIGGTDQFPPSFYITKFGFRFGH